MKWFILFSLILFFNLGNFLDVTQEAKQSDILVYLGGGEEERIEKTLELYKKGYSNSGKLIYTGPRVYTDDIKNYKRRYNKKTFFIKHGLADKNIIYLHHSTNTYNEIRLVKYYLLKHKLHSVIFITDPPHSRRIQILVDFIVNYKKDDLTYTIVSSNAKWWNKNTFFLEKNALIFAISEVIKIPYNYIAYGILEKYGLLSYLKEHFGYLFYKMKSFINKIIQKVWE